MLSPQIKTFESNILNLYGNEGQKWLSSLDTTIQDIASKYNLRDLKPFLNLTYNYVLSGFQESMTIVLKISFDLKNLENESLGIEYFQDFGGVNIIAKGSGFLILERAFPGTSLKSYFPDKESESIELVCDVLQKLAQAKLPKQDTFPHIKDWLLALDQDWGIPEPLLQKAREIRDQLLKTAEPNVFLHGDLHHDNILQNDEDWLVIDPKGVIGEPAYEVAAFIRNPIPELLNHADTPNIIHNRITRFSELLDLSSQRILDWCFVQAVLSWVWAIEDGCDDIYHKNLTEFFEGYTDV